MSQVLDPTLRDLQTRKQTITDELSSVLLLFGERKHPYLGEAMMRIEAHKADILSRPAVTASVQYLSLHKLRKGHEVIVYRRTSGGLTALGEYDRQANNCITMEAPRFVEIFVPEGATVTEQETGLAFVALIKHRIQLFILSA